MDAPCKEKHPSWFKMKLERRELIRQLAPETAVNVLLACWDYLETEEKPRDMSPIENVAFASFMPDIEEAWSKYLQRITAKKESTDIGRYRSMSVDTEGEEEPEKESDNRTQKDVSMADKPPKRQRRRFVPPTVDEVRSYCKERGNDIDPEYFIDFYTTNGWIQGKGKPVVDWKGAVRTWERNKNKFMTPKSSRDVVKNPEDYDNEHSFLDDWRK